MLLSRLSVGGLLRLPFDAVGDGGYAGLVFLVSRRADAPELQTRFLREWDDLHDLTGRYLAVVVPDPYGEIVLDEELYRTQYGTLVEGVRLLDDEGRPNRLTRATRGRPSSVRMAPRRPGTVPEHGAALTGVTTQMQEFFGLSDALLPCLVVVSLTERTVTAVALGRDTTVYDFLKSVKVRLEPGLLRLRQAERSLAGARENRNAVRARQSSTQAGARARAFADQWLHQRIRLAEDLRSVAAAAPPGDLARLAGWLSLQLPADRPLPEPDVPSARALIRLLNEAGGYGRLPRRVARTVAKLNAGHPQLRELLDRKAEADAEVAAANREVGAARAEIDRLARELRLDDAVRWAAEQRHLLPADPDDLLAARELTWPITVRAGHGPSFTRGEAAGSGRRRRGR